MYIYLGRTVMVERPSTVTVVVNGTALLSCRASYSPGLELVYTWSFNDQSIDPEQDNNFKMVLNRTVHKSFPYPYFMSLYYSVQILSMT